MTTSAIKGLDVKITIGGSHVLAGQRGATLNRSAEVIDITNKTGDGWVEKMSSTKEWSVECDGLFVKEDAALQALEEAFKAGTPVQVKLADSDWGFNGSAIITDFPIEAPYDDAATYSLTLEGTGPLNDEE